MSFPRLRFEQAGASAEEADRLEERFQTLSPDAQAGQAQAWAAVGQGDLADALAAEREDEPGEVEEDFPAAAAPEIALPTPPASDSPSTDEPAKAGAPETPSK